MKSKPLFKSKTINSALVCAIIIMMNLLGIGEEKIGETYDTINDHVGSKQETTKDIVALGSLVGVVYGRLNAKTKIGGKDE